MRKLKLLFTMLALMGASSVFAQTNIIADWDGGDDTSSPTNFGWSSSENKTMNSRNAGSGIRMKTDYSGYKLEDGTEYKYSEDSDPSSVIFWVRYGASGESFTYTFQGLEPNSYYDFSALIGWHNNSNAPTFKVVLTDGTTEMATMSKSISTKTTLYSIASTFKTPSTMTNTTDVNIVFTCNQVGDCMEAISALKLVASSVTGLDFAKQDALAALLETGGDNFFTMPQSAIDNFTQRINEATTEADVKDIKDEITNWVAPATSGSWNVKNVNAGCYLGINEENVVLSELPVAITFEKANSGFFIKVGDKYINMKGSNNWDMTATDAGSTEWTFKLNDGKYTISGPNGMIGTDNTSAGSACYGDKNASKNGTWTISEALSEEQIAITVAKNALEAALNAITVPTANIGTGAFQYNSDDVTELSGKVTTAKGVLDSETATAEQIKAQTDIIKGLSPLVLNAPAASDVFNVMITTTDDYAFKNNPLTFNSDNKSGAFFTQNVGINANRAQQITFTKVEDNKYKMSTINADGNEVFLGTNKTINGTGNFNQLRLTTDADKALSVLIYPTSTEGIYNLKNTEDEDNLMGCQDNPSEKATGGFYGTSAHSEFTITAATKPSVVLKMDAEQYATCIFPFKPTLPTSIKAYSINAAEGTSLTLVPVDEPTANVPYVLQASASVNETLTGFGAAVENRYTKGWLTGVYAETDAPVGSYVLQNQSGVVGFYKVAENKQPKVGAYHAYLTVQTAGGETAREAYFFGSETTGIMAIEALTSGNATIFNAAGAQIPALQKGMNIVRKADGKSYKVIVK